MTSALSTFAQSRWTVPALFGLMLALRVAAIALLPQAPHSDGEFYILRAAEMARGLGYQEGGAPTAFWPVGYPALLAVAGMLVGHGMPAAVALNIVGAGVIFALVLWFARTLTGDELAARAAALLYAIYPAHIAYTGAPLSETVSTAVLMAAFALLVACRHEPRLLVCSGLLFGAATLLRTQSLLFPAGALLLLWLVYRDFPARAAVKAGVVVYLSCLLVVAPWTWRNARELGAFVPVSTNGGIGLYTGANPLATGDHMHVERTPLWNAVGVPREQWPARQVEVDKRLHALARAWIADNPGRWLALGARKVVLVWRKDSDAFWGLAASHPDRARLVTALQWGNQAFYMLLLLVAAPALLVGVRGLLRRDARTAPLALLLAAPVFVSAIAFVFTGQVRYHYPAMPFLVIAAGLTASRVVSARGLGWRAIAPAAPARALAS